jgi:hypothetical protein
MSIQSAFSTFDLIRGESSRNGISISIHLRNAARPDRFDGETAVI